MAFVVPLLWRCVDLLEVKVGRSLLINWKVNVHFWEIKSECVDMENRRLISKNKDTYSDFLREQFKTQED